MAIVFLSLVKKRAVVTVEINKSSCGRKRGKKMFLFAFHIKERAFSSFLFFYFFFFSRTYSSLAVSSALCPVSPQKRPYSPFWKKTWQMMGLCCAGTSRALLLMAQTCHYDFFCLTGKLPFEKENEKEEENSSMYIQYRPRGGFVSLRPFLCWCTWHAMMTLEVHTESTRLLSTSIAMAIYCSNNNNKKARPADLKKRVGEQLPQLIIYPWSYRDTEMVILTDRAIYDQQS